MSTEETPCSSSLDNQLRAALQDRREHALLRSLRPLPPDLLDLASNDYLGLSRHPLVIEAAQNAAAQFGTGARASRLVSGQTPIHQQLEAELATFKGCEAALVFSSGYAANLSVISSLARCSDVLFCDKRNHASLVDACRLATANGAVVRYYHSPEKLRALLVSTQQSDVRRIIVSDAVYSMDGDIVDLPQLLQLAEEFDATIILDDAHGLGTLGESGQGTTQHFSIKSARLIQVGTLSKALGSQGGFVAGSRVLIDWLINAARPFIYSTGLAPSSCAAALCALRILRDEPQRVANLRSNAQRLFDGLREMGIDVRFHGTPILPVIIGNSEEALRWSKSLLNSGIWCPAIRPPTVPVDASRLRLTASATLGEKDVQNIVQTFAHLQNELRRPSTE